MRTETTKKLFTVDDYYRMADAGIFAPGERVELIEGEIIEMSPRGARHVACVDRANALFAVAFAGRAIVSVQNNVQLNNYTEPQPDILLLKPREDFYASKKHSPEDVLLVIEVADTSLRHDRQIKLPLYAASGVPEVWIEDLQNDLLLVYREPAGKHYKNTLTLRREDSISIAGFPDVSIKVEALLG